MSDLGTKIPFQCCRCNGPVGVILEVRDPETAKMFECIGSNWHGSWHYDQTRQVKRPPLHIICAWCEIRLRDRYRANASA